MSREIVLIRHAETEWSREGRHTGRTDIPLTEHGRQIAAELSRTLGGWSFATVLVSPLRRAVETCELCGLASRAEAREALMEWDYGDYEGMTSAEIQRRRPGWSLWRDGCPGGEDAERVGARADGVIAEIQGLEGDAAVFAHGHLLRVLAARWIELHASAGARLMLSAGAVGVLAREHDTRALRRWNAAPATSPQP